MLENPRLVVRICQMYYREGLSQAEIGERLRLSRFQVGRILKQALESGIVTIHILEPEPYYTGLAAELEAAFNLRVAIIVDNGDLGGEPLKRHVASAAGRYLLEILKDGDTLGVSLGSTVQEVVESLPNLRNRDVTVMQLIGGGLTAAGNTTSNAIAWQLGQKFGTTPLFLHAPALVDNQLVKTALLTDSHIQLTYAHYKDVSVALAGIGALYPQPDSALVNGGSLDDDQLAELIAQGAVGDVLVYSFDQDGNHVYGSLEERALAIPLEDFLNCDHRIGVAAGVNKAVAILGALRGAFVNVLVTDYFTAKTVLEMHERGE